MRKDTGQLHSGEARLLVGASTFKLPISSEYIGDVYILAGV